MQQLGKKSEVLVADKLQKLTDVHGRPTKLPFLHGNEKVICGFDQGLGEVLYVCDTLEDMQQLYDAYAKGMALSIYWYKGADPGFIIIIPPQET